MFYLAPPTILIPVSSNTVNKDRKLFDQYDEVIDKNKKLIELKNSFSINELRASAQASHEISAKPPPKNGANPEAKSCVHEPGLHLAAVDEDDEYDKLVDKNQKPTYERKKFVEEKSSSPSSASIIETDNRSSIRYPRLSKYTPILKTVEQSTSIQSDHRQQNTRFQQMKLVFDPIRICQKIVIYSLWNSECHYPPPPDLWVSRRSAFRFIEEYDASLSDNLKGLFEWYSGEAWNWWPLDARRASLASEKYRIEWRCVSLEMNIPSAITNYFTELR